MSNVALRHSEEDPTPIRQSWDLSRRVEWFVFTCYVNRRKTVVYSRTSVCPIRCDKFDFTLLPVRKQ